MFRLIGFLIGSLTSIIIILLIVGMPNFHLDDQRDDQQRFDEAIGILKEKQREFESVTGRLSEDVARVAETVEQELEPATAAVAATPPPETATTDLPANPEAMPDILPNEEPGAGETLWYSFWNPFRSEIAASGFVSQLERVTGIDYRVVKVKTGVYEVAFAYQDDEERRTKLSTIAAATGLELPES